MPEALSQALQTEGLVWLALSYLIAGVIRGFTGFGTALIVVPVAGIFLAPETIILLIATSGMLSNIILLPRAWREGDRGEVGILALAAVIGVPLGVAAIAVVDNVTVRWIVTGVIAVTLLAVVSGWQWRGRLGLSGLSAIGFGAGAVGGLTALTGPIALMFYLANARRAEAVRANMILFLGALDVLLIANVAWRHSVSWEVVWLGVIVSVPYLISITLGQALFDPSRERLYRVAAYLVVLGAVLTGLPLWE